MAKHLKRNKILLSIFPALLTPITIFTVVWGLHGAEAASRQNGIRMLEESLRRAVVHCYAIEGYYPESLNYITENYGVYIDAESYSVFYDVRAANIMPDITVIALK